MALNAKEFTTRALTTAFGIVVIGGLALFLPKPYLVLVFVGLSVIGLFELKEISGAFGYRFFTIPGLICLVSGFLSFYLPFSLELIPFLALLLFSLWTLFNTANMQDSMPTLGVNLVGIAYVSAAFFSLAGIFLLENYQGSAIGRHLLLFFFGTVWMGDSAAYLIGSTFGRHKIAPSISPKKSWEGLLGNFLGNLLATFLAKTFFFPFLGIKDVVVLAIVVLVFGFLGDLIESSWKRGSGIKDSGTFIPGHGGILDRVDSIFLSGPVFCAYFHFMFQMN